METLLIPDVESVQPGDIVTLKRGPITITGPAETYTDDDDDPKPPLYVYSAAWPISPETFKCAKREVPDLPTEPGVYIVHSMSDNVQNAKVLRRTESGWENMDGKDAEGIARMWADRVGGLVRLVPEGSEAKKIAEYLWELAAMSHRSPYVTAVLKDAATDIERSDWNE